MVWRDLTRLVYQPLIASMRPTVYKLTPSDMGRTRQSMMASMTPAYLATYLELTHFGDPVTRYTVAFGTPGIYYAKYINNMPTDWLRHPGKHKAGARGRMGRILNDPNAETQFYEKCLTYGRSVARSRWSIFQTHMIGILGGGRLGSYEFVTSIKVRFQ